MGGGVSQDKLINDFQLVDNLRNITEVSDGERSLQVSIRNIPVNKIHALKNESNKCHICSSKYIIIYSPEIYLRIIFYFSALNV